MISECTQFSLIWPTCIWISLVFPRHLSLSKRRLKWIWSRVRPSGERQATAYLEQAAEEAQIVELHCDVAHGQVDGDVGRLHDAFSVDVEADEALGRDSDQRHVEVARRRAEPRAHAVPTQHLHRSNSRLKDFFSYFYLLTRVLECMGSFMNEHRVWPTETRLNCV